MRHFILIAVFFLGYSHILLSQTDLQLEAELVSDFSSYYGTSDCAELPEELQGMSVYRLYIRTSGELIKPYRLWGDQANIMEFIPFGEVYNSNYGTSDCSDLGCDTGWGTGGPIPWIDTWISLGGSPDGMWDFAGLVAGCCQVNFDSYFFNNNGNSTVSPFLQLPLSIFLTDPSAYPLGQTMTTSEGMIELINLNVSFSINQMDEVYIGQYVTNGPMVVRVNFSYLMNGILFDNYWESDSGLEISFGYCFDQNACNYSPDFEVVGTGFEFCEYNSCTPCGGCMDELATNYNSYAEVDNGTCFYPSCTNPDADNYDPIAYEENGSCIFGNGDCENAYPLIPSAEPVLVGVNSGGESSGAEYCWTEQDGAEIVWFSFEASSDEMYVLSEPIDGALLDVVVLDACGANVLSCVDNSDLYYSALPNLNINQTYVVGLRGEPGTVFELSTGVGSVGCNSQNAINFQPGSDIHFGCQFAGCSDPQACNFSGSIVNVDDGSCFYSGAVLKGSVYIDHDLNNSISSSERVANYPLTILPGNDLIYTNSGGYYYYETEDDGPYTILSTQSIGQNNPEFSENLVEDEGTCTTETRNLRLVNLNEGQSFFCQGYPSVEVVICTGQSFFNFAVANDGDVPITAEVTVTISPANSFFNFNLLPSGAEVLSNNQFFVSKEMAPAQNANFTSSIFILSQPFGDMSITYDVTILDPNDEVFAQESYTIPAEFLCSYDPNDKQAFPLGYTEQEFILNDRIQYVINFQNTGNYQAVDVIIEDTLDLNVLDISTFEFIESSHNRFISLYDDGLLQFYFRDIHLPDSTSNPEGSKGFVSFSIKPFDDLPHGTEISNEAYIYFDINEPILTNTVTRTLYYCGTEADVSEIPAFLCADETMNASFENPHLDSTIWFVDDALYSTEPLLELSILGPDTITLGWMGINPLCTESNFANIIVEGLPEIFLNEDNGSLYTLSEGLYQWYDTDGPILGANNSEFLPDEEGEYHLVLISDNGCEYQTESFIVTSVSMVNESEFRLYPNPSSGLLSFESNGKMPVRIEVIDVKGSVLKNIQWNFGESNIDLSFLADGMYFLNFILDDGNVISKRVDLIRK